MEWRWQTVGDAFGISEGVPLPRLAVGSDFVLANVVVYEEPSEFTEVTHPRVGAISRNSPNRPVGVALVHRHRPVEIGADQCAKV